MHSSKLVGRPLLSSTLASPVHPVLHGGSRLERCSRVGVLVEGSLDVSL